MAACDSETHVLLLSKPVATCATLSPICARVLAGVPSGFLASGGRGVHGLSIGG